MKLLRMIKRHSRHKCGDYWRWKAVAAEAAVLRVDKMMRVDEIKFKRRRWRWATMPHAARCHRLATTPISRYDAASEIEISHIICNAHLF